MAGVCYHGRLFTRIPGNKAQAIGSAWLTPLPPEPYPQTSEVVKKIDFWARNEARLVEHSPSKSEALGLVPSTIGTGYSGTYNVDFERWRQKGRSHPW